MNKSKVEYNIKQINNKINRSFRIICFKLDNQEFMLAAKRYRGKVIQLCWHSVERNLVG